MNDPKASEEDLSENTDNCNNKEETARTGLSRLLFEAHPMENFRTNSATVWSCVRGFVIWVIIGFVVGVIGGLVGTAFCYAIRCAAEFRTSHVWIIWTMPAAGALIAALYSLIRQKPTDTNGILLAIHTPSNVPFSTAPLIFICTVITHLVGGSAGREGAALQLGGVLGFHFGRFLNLDEKDTHLIVMAGMSAVFSALFGAPLTAAMFAMEVASVGILHFSAAVPCLTASLTAAYLANWLGASAESFPLSAIPTMTFGNLGAVTVISIIMALMSIVFCISLSHSHRFMDKLLPNPYLRAIAGGLAVALLTFALGTTDYNGAGMEVISRAMEGTAVPTAFLWKLIFTVITMSCGFKGGEIVPSMFIGATLGCVLGNLLGLAPGLGAAVGLLCMFCGSLNCPISTILLGVELFGGANIQFYAVAAVISYIISANFGLYKEQKIVYSKIRPEYINRYTD